MQDLQAYILELGRNARRAATQLVSLRDSVKSAALRKMAAAIRQNPDALLAANAMDVEAAKKGEMQGALIERLKLTEKRINSMAEGVEQIASQVDPVGQIIEGYVRPNGLRIEKGARAAGGGAVFL